SPSPRAPQLPVITRGGRAQRRSALCSRQILLLTLLPTMDSEAEMVEDWTCIGSSRLSIGISRAPGAVVATLKGTADESALETILEAGLKLLDDDAPAVVWDMRTLEEASGQGGEAVVRVMREAQRLEKEVRLVRCGEAMARQLAEMGLRGEFW